MAEDIAAREDLITEVLNRIDKVGEAISQGAVAGFDVLVRQQIINGVVNLIWSTVLFIAAVVIAKHAKKVWRGDYGDMRTSYGEAWCRGFGYGGFFVTGIFCIASLVHLTDGIQKLFNPAYFAIKEVLNTFG